MTLFGYKLKFFLILLFFLRHRVNIFLLHFIFNQFVGFLIILDFNTLLFNFTCQQFDHLFISQKGIINFIFLY
jgi:hypothetical protein